MCSNAIRNVTGMDGIVLNLHYLKELLAFSVYIQHVKVILDSAYYHVSTNVHQALRECVLICNTGINSNNR